MLALREEEEALRVLALHAVDPSSRRIHDMVADRDGPATEYGLWRVGFILRDGHALSN